MAYYEGTVTVDVSLIIEEKIHFVQLPIKCFWDYTDGTHDQQGKESFRTRYDATGNEPTWITDWIIGMAEQRAEELFKENPDAY